MGHVHRRALAGSIASWRSYGWCSRHAVTVLGRLPRPLAACLRGLDAPPDHRFLLLNAPAVGLVPRLVFAMMLWLGPHAIPLCGLPATSSRFPWRVNDAPYFWSVVTPLLQFCCAGVVDSCGSPASAHT